MTPGRIATFIYALALRAFPPAHREKYAEEMIDTFGWELAARNGRDGRWRALRFAAAAWLDAVRAGLGERRRHRVKHNQRGSVLGIGGSWLDVKLGLRMLFKFKGLSLAGGLALAIAIGLGAAWYDVVSDQLHPRLPLPEGDRIVEVEMHNVATRQGERRVLHDLLDWRRDVRAIEELGAYRTLERNLILGDARPEEVVVAEITASAFRLVRVPPLLGRPLFDADEQPGAPPVAVLGYRVWQRRFGGRADAIGQTIQLGRSSPTVVGVMPEGFAFPVAHKLWVPLQLRPAGYAPLEGAAVQVFGRLAPGATRLQAHAEIAALTERAAASSPRTHQHLRPGVVPYGAVLVVPGARDALSGWSWIGLATTHVPILLVLIVACTNVGTLVYARTATREAEIAVRHALGASRGRIVGQLFIEALVLAAVATVAGLASADLILRWLFAYLSGLDQRLPFWIQPGLKFTTVIYAALLAVTAAAILGVLPALKATGSRVHGQLKNLGAGGSTLRFGRVWTTAMIAQVALTVICIPPAIGITQESLRDRVIRARFPAEQYLAASLELDRDAVPARDARESASAYAARLEPLYRELERRVAEEPGVVAVTFGDRLPGMSPAVQSGEVETPPGGEPIRLRNLWTASVGPGYFEAFEKPLLSGRALNDGDRTASPQRVLVNESFARRALKGGNPVGRRVRFTASDRQTTEPWFEIVGMIRDIGMTPTNFGEAPYVFTAASPGTARPLVMGVRTTGDPAALLPRVRAIAAELDAGLRLDTVQPLEDIVWSEDAPVLAISGGIVAVVALGLFLSAAGIFSLMSVSVARRTREIGLRAALGASQSRLLAGIFSRAAVLVGSGVAAGNLGLFALGAMGLDNLDGGKALMTTSALMLIVGLLACVGPARRALRIQPTDALKEA
jgi:putative ABC transport system permease protein